MSNIDKWLVQEPSKSFSLMPTELVERLKRSDAGAVEDTIAIIESGGLAVPINVDRNPLPDVDLVEVVSDGLNGRLAHFAITMTFVGDQAYAIFDLPQK